MSRPEFIVHLAQAWRQHWAGIISADQAAAGGIEPELPASVFVHSNPPLAARDFQPAESGATERQRSASISSNAG